MLGGLNPDQGYFFDIDKKAFPVTSVVKLVGIDIDSRLNVLEFQFFNFQFNEYFTTYTLSAELKKEREYLVAIIKKKNSK